MIESLTLLSFQKWKKLRIVLGPTITSLVGKTESGKSAVLRALQWLLLNQPDGDAFIKLGADTVTVKANIDGKQIKRKRGKGINAYYLDKAKYVSFNRGVPEDISKLANVDELNFQGQHDSAFWLSLNSSEVSRQLNSIVNLTLIDSSLSHINSDVRRARDVVSLTQERLDESTSKLATLSWVSEAETVLLNIDSLEKRLVQQSHLTQVLDDLIQKREKLRLERLNVCNSVICARNAIRLLEERSKLRRRMDALTALVTRLKQVKKKVPIPSFEKLVSLESRLREITSMRKQLQALLTQSTQTKAERCQIQKSLGEAKEELGSLMGKTCPLCDQPL